MARFLKIFGCGGPTEHRPDVPRGKMQEFHEGALSSSLGSVDRVMFGAANLPSEKNQDR